MLLAGGCGDPTGGRQRISGPVTWKRMPLDEGVIEFHAQGDAAPGHVRTRSGALIKDGRYLIPKDKGLGADFNRT
jgi:hypothetical protein